MHYHQAPLLYKENKAFITNIRPTYGDLQKGAVKGGYLDSSPLYPPNLAVFLWFSFKIPSKGPQVQSNLLLNC